jgi:hypothetical protein
LWKEIARARPKIFLQFFHSSSTILPHLEEFGASGLAWRRIVEGKIVEELWKYLVNAAPVVQIRRRGSCLSWASDRVIVWELFKSDQNTAASTLI